MKSKISKMKLSATNLMTKISFKVGRETKGQPPREGIVEAGSTGPSRTSIRSSLSPTSPTTCKESHFWIVQEKIMPFRGLKITTWFS
jgi:hypothetical protein